MKRSANVSIEVKVPKTCEPTLATYTMKWTGLSGKFVICKNSK